MDTELINLCKKGEEIFKPLLEYLPDGLEVQHLVGIENPIDTIFPHVPAKPKALLRLFYAKYVDPLLNYKDPFKQLQEEDDKSKVTLRDCIVGASASKSFKLPAYLISVDKLADYVKENYSPPAIKVLDLSLNNLVDEEGPYITSLVKMLPNCAVVDLSSNRFQGKETGWLIDILKMAQVEVVNISGGSIGTEDCKALLQHTKEFLKKLIFIPEYWLKGEGWRQLIGDNNTEEIIKQVHMKYYKKI
eukprot:TRINITY_DN3390_c0_g1_i1.p2 TRINITY_DN3390_c0_g1~~TRINITY_DN3390_c0_g1_i1.p2  ORF type:complete len:246 (+),score=8.34 TRINITY_DN3390_c0_g1_i1:2-739(+)